MRDEVIIGASVGAIADPVEVGDLEPYVFELGASHFRDNAKPALCASGITGEEEVKLWTLRAGVWAAVTDGDGEQIKLTATNLQEVFNSGGKFGLSKSSGTGIVVTIEMP